MKKNLSILMLIISFQNANVFGQVIKTDLVGKVNIVSDIINRISDSTQAKKQISTGLINTAYREVYLEEGFAYTGIRFSPYITDSLFVQELEKVYKKKNYLLFEYSQINSSRGDMINSSSIFNRDSCNHCVKLYFEIGFPIEGWEIFCMLNNERFSDTLFFDKYYTKQVSIPVFIYSTANGIISKTNCIFLYELSKGNKFKFIKKIFI